MDAGLPYDLPLDFFETVKDERFAVFGGRSFRQACIDKSEMEIKPIYGVDHYGKLMVRVIADNVAGGCPLIAITDLSFAAEAWPVIKAVGTARCMLIRLHAAGRGKIVQWRQPDTHLLAGGAVVRYRQR